MATLYANRRRKRGKTQIERNELRFDAPFLLFVCEYLADAIACRIGIVGKADLTMLVVGDAAPEADRVDDRTWRTPLALAQDFGLVCVDARMVIFPVDPRNVIKRIVLCDRESEKALIENVRGADRSTVAVR